MRANDAGLGGESTRTDVLTLGESMASIRASGLLRHGGSMSMSLGGAESNVAIALSRLGHRARWLGRVGDDEFGAFIARTLRAEGVLGSPLVDPDRPTGVMFLESRIADISRVAYYRAGSAGSAISAADVTAALADPPRILHVTGITPALSEDAADACLTAVRDARAAGVLVSFDVNFRSKLWSSDDARPVLRDIAEHADILIASDDELPLVASGTGPGTADETEVVHDLHARGVGQVVIKRGADGATAWVDGAPTSAPARPVTVIDTVGAGDAFTAGYLSAVLDGMTVAERLDRGVVLGAFAVSASGDWEALPTRAELGLLDRAVGSTIR
ncbi:sugar kinase [Planctomonas psychrotolerans]|uniref:sugar kinase n=1 Tax=Planctomonas psychrotolerans TaxID=2528712 RepID=UPI001D0D72BE|nr:sugar kinase [Planctomonas psychrotolerans]